MLQKHTYDAPETHRDRHHTPGCKLAGSLRVGSGGRPAVLARQFRRKTHDSFRHKWYLVIFTWLVFRSMQDVTLNLVHSDTTVA